MKRLSCGTLAGGGWGDCLDCCWLRGSSLKLLDAGCTGGGISVEFRTTVSSSAGLADCCLDDALLGALRAKEDDGVTERARDSPMVIRTNSH